MLLRLRESLPELVRWHNVLGGLAPDTDQPMPEQTRQMVQSHWRKIQSTIGTEFNFRFWSECRPRRDTYKACRAVIAASYQQAEEPMIEAVQRAYYLRAMNPSEPATLAQLAGELGLDQQAFRRDLISERTESEFRAHRALRAKLNVRVFPSLVLEHRSVVSPVDVDYHDYRTSLTQIHNRLAAG